MKQGIIYRSEGSLFNYIGWPTVAKDEKGVIYVVASGHRLGHVCPFGKNYMFKSYDNAKTWEGPIIINDTLYDDRDAGILPLGDGKMILSWFINNIDVYTSRYDRITKYAIHNMFFKMKTVVSGIRSTGNLHLGNYYGALKNFIRMQEQNRCFFDSVVFQCFLQPPIAHRW